MLREKRFVCTCSQTWPQVSWSQSRPQARDASAAMPPPAESTPASAAEHPPTLLSCSRLTDHSRRLLYSVTGHLLDIHFAAAIRCWAPSGPYAAFWEKCNDKLASNRLGPSLPSTECIVCVKQTDTPPYTADLPETFHFMPKVAQLAACMARHGKQNCQSLYVVY